MVDQLVAHLLIKPLIGIGAVADKPLGRNITLCRITNQYAACGIAVVVSDMNKHIFKIRNVFKVNHALVQVGEPPCVSRMEPALFSQLQLVVAVWDPGLAKHFFIAIFILQSKALKDPVDQQKPQRGLAAVRKSFEV